VALLDDIASPADLRRYSKAQLEELAAEIRQFLITHVSRTGGHLGPNLGVVELTIALHRVFDSPHDPIIFDTGHQSYVHKILTGRAGRFDELRQQDGLSGYPSRSESEHDWVENSHASASLSWAEGLAKAYRLQGVTDRTVVAVIGDGALTGGMAWEALNNIAVEPTLQLVIVVNDNGRSYSPTVGGLTQPLAGLRTDPRYEQAADLVRRAVRRTPLVGDTAAEFMDALRAGLRDVFVPQSMFADLGIKYIGPFDGHDIGACVRALRQAKRFGGPVIVHAITRKGAGYSVAQANDERFHAIEPINQFTGEPLSASVQATWTDAFAQEMVEIGATHPRVVALTAAMLGPTGLGRFAAAYPGRVFDVGIAEQHAVGSAAGLAIGGLHPVFAVYSTFLNRAFDQVLMDVALHRLGVTFVLDRAGITGPDGPSHHGMWDVGLAGLVPGLRLAEPRDRPRLHDALLQAVETDDGPTMVRFCKDKVPDDLPAVSRLGSLDVLVHAESPQVVVVGCGAMARTACQVAQALEAQSVATLVVDPVWLLPVPDDLVEVTRHAQLVVTIEDNVVAGGFGSQLHRALDAAGVGTPLRLFGLPTEFLPAGSRAQVLERAGLTARHIAREVIEAYTHLAESEPAALDDRSVLSL